MSYIKKFWRIKSNKGMTYVELIVVLAIFSIMSSIIMFNYQDFQSKIEVKSLANDIALKIVQAQKDAMSGKLTPNSLDVWKPSYGVYFNSSPTEVDSDGIPLNKEFIYFADLDNSSSYEANANEKLGTIFINKKFKISSLQTVCGGTPLSPPSELSIVFKRPDSAAVIRSTPCDSITSASINLSSLSSSSTNASITIYPSGRIQIN